MALKNKIMLVDDHPLVREWLTNLINDEPDFEVCGVAGNAPEALALTGTLQPQVVIVDISLEGGSGLELIKDIKALQPQIRLLVLSMHDELQYAERAMRAGAAGYIMKREATGKVLEGLRTVLQGRLYFSNEVNAMLAQKHVSGAGDQPMALESLSDRELEVFQLLGRGLSTRQVSEQMHVGFKTVHVYCSRIREKLNFATINELVFQAIRWHESQQPR
ncbi:MAG: response regulator transcription factor [Verrucomicrobiae bacterium]|nr:response regulator transcription factor [Verrucomicrobiae bacterium]